MVRPDRSSRVWILGLCATALAVFASPAGSRAPDDAYVTPPWFPSGPPSREFLATLPADVHVDNFGNAWVTRGSGRPHVLVLAHRDAPGWIVSEITKDGYLRLQRLGTGATPLIDQFLVGKRLVVYTRRGPLPAVCTAPSTHFRRGATVPVPEATVDDLWIDVGAESDGEAREMGIALLDPVTPLDHHAEIAALGPHRHNEVGGYAAGVRASCEVLGILAKGGGPARGSLTCAWVAGGTEGARGSRRLLATLPPVDSVVVIEPLPIDSPDSLADHMTHPVAILPADSAYAACIQWANAIATRWPNVAIAANGPAVPDGRVWSAAGIPTVVLAIPVYGPGSPGERVGATIDALTTANLIADAHMRTADLDSAAEPVASAPWVRVAIAPRTHASSWRAIDPLLAAYGVSEHESAVAAAVRAQLPAGAARASVVDERGNLELRLGAGPPARIFVAHMDEIGYRVTSVEPNGRAHVERRGGFYDWLYEGETVRIAPEMKEAYAGIVPPRVGSRVSPRPAVARPLQDEVHLAPPAGSKFDVTDVRLDTDWTAPRGSDVTVLHEIARLGRHRFAARAIDDRFGDAALVMAARELWPERHHLPNAVWLVWSVEEETGLKGATWLADSLAHHNALPIRVHAVDTFVASDSPLENPRIGGAKLGQGAVIRAVDTSHEAPPEAVYATLRLAREHDIPLQYGVTAGGNDGVPFAEHGSINVPLGWPLRSSHSAVEVADLRDLESLAKLVQVLAEQPARDDPRMP